MKLTRHNGRFGKNGVYNPKHNDRSFDVKHSDHIDKERVYENVYWDCYNGYHGHNDLNGKDSDMASNFEDVEKLYYKLHYGEFVSNQNDRNIKNRHPERNRSTDDLLYSKKTCPEETILQIGKMEQHVPMIVLHNIATEYILEFNKRFGSHIHILDMALHLDESTPHIHERHVFDCENKYGEICPQQEKALEALGFELPEPDKKPGRYNNRKIVFDSACRTMLFDICKSYGLELEDEPEYGGRKYLEKQDYIIERQRERLEDSLRTQYSLEQELNELTMKIEDVDTLLDDVAQVAYDKAVEVVSDAVREETQKQDIAIVSEYRNWVMQPERKASLEKRTYAAARLDKVIEKIKGAAQTVFDRVHQSLMKPEMKKTGTEQIKEKAKMSVKDRLAKARIEADAYNQNRREIQKPKQKHDMEL